MLSRVMEYAARKEALEVSPILKTDYADNHRRGKKSATATKRFAHNPLTTGQLGAVSAALRGEVPDSDGLLLPAYPVYTLMVEFLASTGLRSAEDAGLEIRDIRFTPALVGHGVKGQRLRGADENPRGQGLDYRNTQE